MEKQNLFDGITGLTGFSGQNAFIGCYPVILSKIFVPACPDWNLILQG
jgi:hypothetical protein